VRLSSGLKVKVTETINLSDPNLALGHRDRFIMLVKGRVAQLDELIASWYRHRGECRIEGCDCGGDDLAEQAGTMCTHLSFIKDTFGEAIIDGYPHFGRLVKEAFGPRGYEVLSSHKTQ
jgi:hypothetical protein